MEIYLIRHTTPKVDKGICYGQTDLDVTDTFVAEAAIIKTVLPSYIHQVYSSPLQRCTKLATHVFPDKHIALHPHLMEIYCGDWEMQAWDDIPKEHINPWMDDFVNVRTPNGENYVDLYNRVVGQFTAIAATKKPAAIVAHGGVIRSILSYITNTPLIDSFNAFTLHYGCVVKIHEQNNVISYSMLSNIPHEKETHKPKQY
jgi:alpha-ribazole phosphatase